ncbi:hypothetical protein G6F55_012199 [Rhizopus delemar]|uniref:RGS domain-containing protein n=2 Tax=Rhizopus TaxID=4842 RepID=A0A9P6YR86_9FUNG|nr:hypothetical protein G6F43_008098 [Rhizopus delemar]KAG1533710.1 hypothetical protein G6F51_012475 [Rhizopus arrhizus]KAG1444802.1 hypothetical protein G6F55_012199 [Rhizopus delemar]KAG1488161.1 hypothetical protein G6F54_012226 [Rhizopus delemar]KAG1497516.1 hypothetical protein G6F53_011955 [Rhizopus delemar]
MYSSFVSRKPKDVNLENDEDEDDSSISSPISPLTPGTQPHGFHFFTSFNYKNEPNMTRQYRIEPEPYRERSSSVGSIVSVHQQPRPPRKSSLVENETHFQLFRKPSVSLCVSIKEIKQTGLKLLLQSMTPLGYFLYYLLTEYSSENLFFYLAVDSYQNHPFSSQVERCSIASRIASDYLSSSSELEVNLDDRIQRLVQKALEQQQSTLISSGHEFDAAKRHVFSLLNSSYHRFRMSSVWAIMESKCNELYNSERSQALIVNLLLSYIKHTKNGYCQEVSKLVHSFCLVHLPAGYQQYSNQSFAAKSRPEPYQKSKFDLLGKKFHIK